MTPHLPPHPLLFTQVKGDYAKNHLQLPPLPAPLLVPLGAESALAVAAAQKPTVSPSTSNGGGAPLAAVPLTVPPIVDASRYMMHADEDESGDGASSTQQQG